MPPTFSPESLEARLAAIETRLRLLENDQIAQLITGPPGAPVTHGLEMAILRLGVAVAERAGRDDF
jgi:hypothetical protein